MSDSESGNETVPKQGVNAWFGKMKSKLTPRKPKWWRSGGKALNAAGMQSLKQAGFTVNPEATIDTLWTLASDKSAPLEAVVATLEQKNFWQAGEGEDYAISSVVEAIESENETFVKGWVLIKINSAGYEQERVMLLTDKAYYTAKYDYDAGKVRKVRRHPLNTYVACRTGQLAKAKEETYGILLTLSEKNPGLIAKVLSGKDREFTYERAFRSRASLEQAKQQSFMEEVAWAVYAVAYRLAEQEISKPSTADIGGKSKFSNLFAAVHNAAGVGMVKDSKKEAHAASKS